MGQGRVSGRHWNRPTAILTLFPKVLSSALKRASNPLPSDVLPTKVDPVPLIGACDDLIAGQEEK
ncbi:MAG: hypothetical protein O7H41_00125 [Planctomycetota bacterium]|nr:hypothetical protein [Planctomycetota bacterium]